MATIGYAHTLNDLRKQLNPDGSIDHVIEILNKSNPIMEDIVWEEGDLPIGAKTTIRASLPEPSIRRINRGTAATKGTVKQVIDVCMHLEDRSVIDVELLKGKPNPEMYRLSEDDAHVEGMGQYVANQFVYGDLNENPEAFNGFMARYNTLTGDKGSVGFQVVSAGTPGTNTNASILMIDWGDRRVTGIYPKNTQAGLKKEDLGENDVFDANGLAFRAVRTLYSWKCGLAVHNVRSVARVCNINMSTILGGSMTTAAGKELINKFIYAKNRLWHPVRPVCYVPENLYSWLECWLNNKDNVHITRQEIMGQPPVLYFAGMQVKKMECMKETEAAIV